MSQQDPPPRAPEKTSMCVLPTPPVESLSFHNSLQLALVNRVGSAGEA